MSPAFVPPDEAAAWPRHRPDRERIVLLDVVDAETIYHLTTYLGRLRLPAERLRVTTARPQFARWLGRRVRADIGGAYACLRQSGGHIILINLPRIDRGRPRSLEVVVAEELIH